jgi:hypothetical protein
MNITIPEQTYTSTFDSSSVGSCHGSEVTSQVLMDLLANSIAIMRLDDTHVDEWMQMLRE